jgi:subtilisin family serine protease
MKIISFKNIFILLLCFAALLPKIQAQNDFLIKIKAGQQAQAEAAGAKIISKRWQIYSLQNIDNQVFIPKFDWAETVQFDHIISLRAATPNDSYYSNGQMWQHDLIRSPMAWAHTRGGVTANGDTIVVAVIDGGCDLAHPDLMANLWQNRHEIDGNGIDDDGNGYIDDFNGWNNIANNDSLPNDTHGTSVAGLVGAVGNNGIGVVGINWQVKIMPLLANYSGTSIRESQVLAAYSYVADMRELYAQTGGQRGAFIVATNASFGIDRADAADYPLWCGVYDALGALGVLSVGATNNNIVNVDAVGDMPTTCDSDFLIAVTETNRQDKLNAAYGAINIDLSAPANAPTTRANGLYGNFGGTSAAAPLVAGAVALMLAYPDPLWAEEYQENPTATLLLIKNILIQTAHAAPDLQGKSVSGGRLDIGAAMKKLDDRFRAPNKADFISLFPNPAQNILQIKTANNDAANLQNIIIYNTLGQEMQRETLQNERAQTLIFQIDISHLGAGAYFLHWQCGETVTTKAFIKIAN